MCLVSPTEILTWVHGNKINLTAMDCICMPMVKNIRESSSMARNQDEVTIITRVEPDLKENGKKIRKMGSEYFSTPTTKNIKEIG